MPLIEKTGFVINSADMCFHYRNIWEQLDKNSFDVILIKDEENTEALIGNLYNCIKYHDIIKNDIKYKYLISHQYFGFYEKDDIQEYIIKKIGLLNVRFMYALGKNAWNYSDWNNLYDLILCYGPHQQEQFRKFPNIKTIAVGYPRYDDYFKNTIDTAAIKKKLNCLPGKKTIVYLPTYSTLSSIDLFAPTLAELTHEYNVIVKPHPGVISGEPARAALLRELNFTKFIEGTYDNLLLYAVADYVICDYGGTLFGAVYLDKNLLLLNLTGAENDNNTGEDSNDIQLREKIINLDYPDLNGIKKILQNEKIWLEQQIIRNELRYKYFSPYFGFASGMVAQIIRNFDMLFAKEILENRNNEIDAIVSLSETLIEEGILSQAGEVLGNALQKYGVHYKLLNNLAAVKLIEGNVALAEELLNEALTLNQGNPAAEENLGLIRAIKNAKTNN